MFAVLFGGHQLAEECPKEVAREYLNFFGEMTGKGEEANWNGRN